LRLWCSCALAAHDGDWLLRLLLAVAVAVAVACEWEGARGTTGREGIREGRRTRKKNERRGDGAMWPWFDLCAQRGVCGSPVCASPLLLLPVLCPSLLCALTGATGGRTDKGKHTKGTKEGKTKERTEEVDLKNVRVPVSRRLRCLRHLN
jgi:hypothetical protein